MDRHDSWTFPRLLASASINRVQKPVLARLSSCGTTHRSSTWTALTDDRTSFDSFLSPTNLNTTSLRPYGSWFTLLPLPLIAQCQRWVVNVFRVEGYQYHPITNFSGIELVFEAAQRVSPRVGGRWKGFPSQHRVEFPDSVRYFINEGFGRVHHKINIARCRRDGFCSNWMARCGL